MLCVLVCDACYRPRTPANSFAQLYRWPSTSLLPACDSIWLRFNLERKKKYDSFARRRHSVWQQNSQVAHMQSHSHQCACGMPVANVSSTHASSCLTGTNTLNGVTERRGGRYSLRLRHTQTNTQAHVDNIENVTRRARAHHTKQQWEKRQQRECSKQNNNHKFLYFMLCRGASQVTGNWISWPHINFRLRFVRTAGFYGRYSGFL